MSRHIARSLHVAVRSEFNTWRAKAFCSGGGRDYSIEAIKVEIQSGFSSRQEAVDWLCPRFELRYLHNWCGVHVWMDGRYWWLQVDCSLDNLPIDAERRGQ